MGDAEAGAVLPLASPVASSETMTQDLLEDLVKVDKQKVRQNNLIMRASSEGTAQGRTTSLMSVMTNNTPGQNYPLGNQEEVTLATDSLTAHEILFKRRKEADMQVKMAKTRSEGAIARPDPLKPVEDASFISSLFSKARDVQKSVIGMISRTVSGTSVNGEDQVQPTAAIPGSPQTSPIRPISGDPGGEAEKSQHGTPHGDEAGTDHDAERKELERNVLESRGSFVVNNAPRQRWVTATWYAAQEAQRNQSSSEETHTAKEKLNLVEAVKKVMEQDENADKAAALAEKERYNARMRTYLESRFVSFITVFATIFVLYAADVTFLLNDDPSMDFAVYAVNFACALIFVLEVLLRSSIRSEKQKNHFFLSFFFWLDIIAIISLIPDIVFWVTSIGKPGGINTGYNMWSGGSDTQTSAAGGFDLLTLARSGRAARAGARAAKIVRVLNLIHKVRSLLHDLRAVRDDMGQDKAREEADLEATKKGESSSVPSLLDDGNDMGSKLDRRITRYFVYCVGAMLIVAIVLSASFERNYIEIVETDLKSIALVYHTVGYNSSNELWGPYLEQFISLRSNPRTKLLYLAHNEETLFGTIEAINNYRVSPVTVVNMKLEFKDHVYAVHIADIQSVHNEYISNISFTTAVIIILGGLTWLMSSAVRHDVVVPMDGLMRIIQSIRRDPMKPVPKFSDSSKSEVREVVAVEQALVQLGALLQMGLGEAGAKIIRTSLKDNGLDVNVAGKIINAIYGFCDIRNFTDCTEVLQADVVKLVNNVGSIVHDVTIENHGAPNKNIGDAFLLVWKPKGSLTVRQIAESALRSYVSIIIEMARDEVLRKWAARHDIQDRMPGYVVRLGCGLHYGWAIECAIGSQHKIDASYLSPHVNLSSRLEAATKQYGVAILLSGDMHGLMSDEVQGLCRLIDRVTVKGSNAPMYLYTYDVPSLMQFGGSLPDNVKLGLKDVSLYDYWKRVRPYTSEKYRLTWQRAMYAYLGGPDGTQADWHLCKTHLQKCLTIFPNDGPALAILAYIENNCVEGDIEACKQPGTWKGFRGLTDK